MTSLQNLQQQKQREITQLRSRVAALATTLQDAPAHWVGQHPYIAIAGAALAGFAAAQIPCGMSRLLAPAPSPAPPAAAPSAPASGHAEILSLLVNLALQFLSPPHESSPPAISIADTGAVVGTSFPPFSSAADSRAAQPLQ